ncbi:hypothetical protein A2U01_0000996 [Trifolium medium]|uniref:Uncharacterized protein n=1 Tax=Trifolium medium TaxID=97028 RepID=A0A392LZ01_9FABA|nr:hypothetical protein [Trifolium medium]
MLSCVFNDTAREASITGKVNSWYFEFIDDITSSAMKRANDYAIRSVLEEELFQRFEEKSIFPRTSKHVCLRYFNVFRSVEGVVRMVDVAPCEANTLAVYIIGI